jgi:hypothetical protein
MTAPLTWQKSTYSQEHGDCLELTAHGGAVLLRESDDPTVILTTTRTDLAHFIQFLKVAQSPAQPGPAAG